MAYWWEHNRLLTLGSRGEDVKRLQQATNNWLSEPMTPTGVYDAKTVERIKEIQRLNGLVDDGKAGPITQSLILEKNYTFSITTPPVVQQPPMLCWGAAVESVLKSTWIGWPKLTSEQLRQRYAAYLLQTGFMSPRGIERVMVDHRASIKLLRGSQVRVEKISSFLFRYKKQILLGDFLLGAGHVRVIYGVTVKDGQIGLMVMDPMAGLTTVDLGMLQDAQESVFFAAPFPVDVISAGL